MRSTTTLLASSLLAYAAGACAGSLPGRVPLKLDKVRVHPWTTTSDTLLTACRAFQGFWFADFTVGSQNFSVSGITSRICRLYLTYDRRTIRS